jgi:hypothetical protein
VSVDSRHMGAECARVATVNRPRLVLCLLLKGHDLIDEHHRQGVLTLLTSFDGPTHEHHRQGVLTLLTSFDGPTHERFRTSF